MRSSSWAVFAAALLNPLSAEASDFPDCAKGPLANNTVCDPKASPADRAAALVAAMNINEKLANLVEYVSSDLQTQQKKRNLGHDRKKTGAVIYPPY